MLTRMNAHTGECQATSAMPSDYYFIPSNPFEASPLHVFGYPNRELTYAGKPPNSPLLHMQMQSHTHHPRVLG